MIRSTGDSNNHRKDFFKEKKSEYDKQSKFSHMMHPYWIKSNFYGLVIFKSSFLQKKSVN